MKRPSQELIDKVAGSAWCLGLVVAALGLSFAKGIDRLPNANGVRIDSAIACEKR